MNFNYNESLFVGVNQLRPLSARTPVNLESRAFEAFGSFEAQSSVGSIVGWTPSSTGQVKVVDLAGNGVAHLTTGSPVSITQNIATPDSAFEILFDYQFLTTTGTLDVLLNHVSLASIAAPDSLSGFLDARIVTVTNPGLRNLADVELTFQLNGLTQGEIYLDNISARSIQTVPLPAASWLFLSGVFALLGNAKARTARLARSAKQSSS